MRAVLVLQSRTAGHGSCRMPPVCANCAGSVSIERKAPTVKAEWKCPVFCQVEASGTLLVYDGD